MNHMPMNHMPIFVPLLWRLLLQLHGFVFVKAFAGCDFAFAGCGCRLAFGGSGGCRLDWVVRFGIGGLSCWLVKITEYDGKPLSWCEADDPGI